MNGRLKDKVCLVTGAAQGIGLSVVERFAAEGAHVIAADINFGATRSFGATVERVILDVTDPTAVAAVAASHPDISVLVNGVGYVASGALLDSTLEDLDRSFDINVRSMAITMSALLPGMLRAGGGSIINIASVVSSVMAAPNRFAYATTKAAVIGLTMSVARDYVDRGIRCNSISPGTVETPSLHQRFAETGDLEKARASFVARQPMGRLGQADEISAVAAMLASDEAAFMTGSNIVIDGGMSL